MSRNEGSEGVGESANISPYANPIQHMVRNECIMSAKPKKTIWNIVMYCFIVTAVAFISPLLGGSPNAPGIGFYLWVTAPALVAILMRFTTRDWSDAGIKLAIRKNVRWYLISIVVSPVLMVFTLLSGAMISGSSISGFSMVPYFQTVLPAFIGFFIFAIFEEFGWRGYLAPKLASIGISSFLGYAITAVVWATWHLPYIRELTWVYSSGDLITFIPRYYLLLFAVTILYNEIRLITGSVWPAVLMHAIANSIQHPLDAEYLTIVPGMEYLVSFNGFFIIAFIGLLGITLNRWRMRKERLLKPLTQNQG